jgi:trk system potassium uptake protein
MSRKESILILGLGGVGYYLAKWLAHEGYAITAIESNPALIARADGEIDARLVRGDAMSFACWKEVHAEKMDYVIAVTDNDAVNITASMIASKCGIPRKIARVRNLELWADDALLSAEDLGIDLVIRPGELTAQEIARLLKMRSGNVVIDIDEGHVQVMATRITKSSPLSHMAIRDITEKHDDFLFRIVAIARDIDTFIPAGGDKVLPGDHVYILVHTENFPQLMKLVGEHQKNRHKVLIIGGGLVGSRVAELLQDKATVRLIEKSEQRAEELSYILKKTECLHGDGSSSETLLQAGLLEMDTIITATEDNETNIMTSVLAKHLIQSKTGHAESECGKTIALVKRQEYLVLASSMGADIVLNQKVLAGNRILKYIRRGKLLSMAHLHGCDAEVVELVADIGSPITRKPLKDIGGMRKKMLIGSVSRNGTWGIAIGTTQVEAGDRVIGICVSRYLPDLERLFDA